MTITKQEFTEILSKHNIIAPSYGMDVLVRTAHHSSAIEPTLTAIPFPL
ncbi:hypothetical protein [Pseudolactococcus insecticola]|nr:hypothetical protein [Lactococcus insecticola]